MAAWTTSASQRTSPPKYLQCVNSINGIISETVLQKILEDDRLPQEDHHDVQQETFAVQQEQPAELDEEQPESADPTFPEHFNWADDVEETYGPVTPATGARKTSHKTPKILDSYVSKHKYALLLHNPSEADRKPAFEYASDSTVESTSSVEFDGPSDLNYDVLLAPARYDFVFSDDKLEWYAACNMYLAFENRYDYLLFRMMRHTPKPNHLLRDYDLWLQRRQDRKEVWKRDMKVLDREIDETKAAVDNRLAHVPQNCGASRHRTAKK